MTSNRKFLVAASASALAIAAFAGAASAQTPVFGGTTGATSTTTVNKGSSTTTTTGSETKAPYTATTTTVQQQSVVSTTNPTTTAVSGTVGGAAYTGDLTVSGAGSQARTETTQIIQVYNPGPPPTPAGPPTTPPPVYNNVGNPTVTAVSVSGAAGTAPSMATPTFEATISSSGPVSSTGSVTATENDIYMSTAGTTYTSYVGTATYSPSSGAVTVALPTAATDSTSITSSGLTTTGSVTAATVNAGTLNVSGNAAVAGNLSAGSITTGAISATSLDLNGGQIHNLGNGTALTDATNLYQLQAGLGNLRKVAAGGTAVAAAMSGSYFIPGKKLNFSINLADYGAQGAFAANVGYLITPSIAINAGVATGFEYGATAGRIGATMGF